MKLKNLAIVAHVDHGKTTLVDQLLSQSGALQGQKEEVERVMDSGDIERERGITITAKNCAMKWKDTKINLLDTPGHADFGGEVERALMMVDGIILLVDAAEGPLPQTRFVLQKALDAGLKCACVINKVDRPDQRALEVKDEVEELFLELISELGRDDVEIDIPFFYASGKDGWASETLEEKTEHLEVLLDFMVSDYFPEPDISPGENLQLLVTNLSYSPYLGQLIIGRIQRGVVIKNKHYVLMQEESKKKYKITNIQLYDALKTREVDEARAGEIAIIAGTHGASIGDTLCCEEGLEPLKRISVEPPTVSVNVSVSTSPFSGKDGEYLTSRKLEEFLEESCLHNVALKYEATEDPKIYNLKGRGELQLAIVFEELRRKGFEFMVSRPEVVLNTAEDGSVEEPFEQAVFDIPSEFVGAITELLSNRKGRMTNMAPIGDNRTRVDFEIPSRGLIGFRSRFLTETKGEGLMSSLFLGYKPFMGKMLARNNGAIIADRKGKSTPYALFNLISLGKQFIRPGEEVYEGMVLGEHVRSNDINVNAIKEKHLSSMRTAGKDENIVLPPIEERTLDWALDWIDNDEWVEVTPLNIRIRKKNLAQNTRSVIR